MLRSLLALLVFVAACGSRSELGAASTNQSCAGVAWSACKAGPKITLGGGDMPDVAWTGTHFLVVSEDGLQTSLRILNQAGDTASSSVLFGYNGARVAWNPALGVGLIFTRAALYWVDANGAILGSRLFPIEFSSSDVAATAEGFLALATTRDDSNSANPVYSVIYASLGATAADPRWNQLASGLAWKLEHAVDDTGNVTAFAMMPSGGAGLLVRVQAGVPGAPETLVLPPTSGLSGDVVALATSADRALLLFGGQVPPDNRWALWLTEQTPSPRAIRVDQAPNGPDGALLWLGGDLILASATIQSNDRVSVARVDPDGMNPIGPLVILAEASNLSRSARMTRTPRGLALVWWEGVSFGQSVRFQTLDCCVAPPTSP